MQPCTLTKSAIDIVATNRWKSSSPIEKSMTCLRPGCEGRAHPGLGILATYSLSLVSAVLEQNCHRSLKVRSFKLVLQ